MISSIVPKLIVILHWGQGRCHVASAVPSARFVALVVASDGARVVFRFVLPERRLPVMQIAWKANAFGHKVPATFVLSNRFICNFPTADAAVRVGMGIALSTASVRCIARVRSTLPRAKSVLIEECWWNLPKMACARC